MSSSTTETGFVAARDGERSWKLKLLLLSALLFVPLLNGSVLYLSSLGAFEGINLSRNELVQQFLWTKVLADVVFLIVLSVFLYRIVSRSRVLAPYFPTLLAFVGVMSVSIATTAVTDPIRMILGLRYFSSVVLFFVAFDMLTERDIEVIGRTVLVLGVLASLLGIVQFVLGGGLTTGRVGRLYGVFSVFSYPSSFASVLGLAGAFLVVDRSLSRKAKAVYLSLFLVTIFLTRSGTGIAVFGVLLLVWLYRQSSILVLTLAGVCVVAAIPVLTRRGDIWSSLAMRFEIFFGYLITMSLPSLLFGRGLGWGIDASAFLVRANVIAGPIMEADSFYTAALLQIGVFGIVVFLLFNGQLFTIATRKDSKIAKTITYLIPLVLVVSATRNTFALFPINWVYWMACGVFTKSLVR